LFFSQTRRVSSVNLFAPLLSNFLSPKNFNQIGTMYIFNYYKGIELKVEGTKFGEEIEERNVKETVLLD